MGMANRMGWGDLALWRCGALVPGPARPGPAVQPPDIGLSRGQRTSRGGMQHGRVGESRTCAHSDFFAPHIATPKDIFMPSANYGRSVRILACPEASGMGRPCAALDLHRCWKRLGWSTHSTSRRWRRVRVPQSLKQFRSPWCRGSIPRLPLNWKRPLPT